MNQEIKARWLTALRCGQYAQGRLGMRIGKKYDPLGVLCDVVDPTGWEGPEAQRRHRGHAGYPAPTVLKASDLRYGDAKYLTNLNDFHPGLTFPQIADFIENKL